MKTPAILFAEHGASLVRQGVGFELLYELSESLTVSFPIAAKTEGEARVLAAAILREAPIAGRDAFKGMWQLDCWK